MNYVDFKADYISNDKFARHILVMANSIGGLIAIGVQEVNGKTNPIGIEQILDKADIENGLNKLLLNNLEFEFLDFTYEENEYVRIQNKSFQAILIQNKIYSISFKVKTVIAQKKILCLH